MNWVALILAVLSAGGIAYGVGQTRLAKSPVSIMKVFSQGRERLRLMLMRLEKEDEPDFCFGAMCYEPMALPERADYLCPVCGTRTVYTYSEAEFILSTLPSMRRIAAELDESGHFRVSLEELLCSECFGEDASNSVNLVVVYAEGDTVRTRAGYHDMMLLRGFVAGDLFYITDNDGQYPLKEHSQRIRELLGLE
jgi:hypothetical protein